MSEKPFWEGKTLMEIQNLDKRVKVTMENGDVFIGKLVRRSRDTDGICSLSMQLDAHRTYLHVFSAESSDTQPVIPSYVDTVELLDDPEYERIDNIEDVREGDVYVGTDGNRYTVLRRTTSNLQPLTVAVINTTFYPHRSYFGYALRPTPKLPDHDGLWLDRVGNTWTMRDGKVHIIRTSDGDWCFTRPWFYTDSVQVVNAGPFRPAKVVEA